MKTLLIVALMAVILPVSVYGAQAVFTAKNVSVAYEEQIKAIDAEIARLEGTLVILKPNSTLREFMLVEDGVNLEIRNKIQQLNEDKHTLELAHTLLLASFR